MNQTIVAVATNLSIAQIKIAAAIANLGINIQTYCIADAIPLILGKGKDKGKFMGRGASNGH